MVNITLENIEVIFPAFGMQSRSFKGKLLSKLLPKKENDFPHLPTPALSVENLQIKEGERVGIIGPNGAGKTTLLRTLSGIYVPTVGAAEVNGRVISFINIFLGMDQEFSGRENIYLRSIRLGWSRSEVKKYTDEIIDFCQLGEYIDYPLRTYSTGMQMRLAFAIVTALRSDILIMDEWLSVGDEQFTFSAQKRLKSFIDNAKIIVLASHSRDLIMNTCNRVIYVNNGKIVLDGDPEAVCGRYFQG